jgi:hypothetical protein
VGSKLVVALAVGRSRRILTSPSYRWALGALGAILAVFAAILIAEGAKHLMGRGSP